MVSRAQGLPENILTDMKPSCSEGAESSKEAELRPIQEATEVIVYEKYHKKYTVLLCARLPFPCPLRGAAGERRRLKRGTSTEVTRPHQSPDSIHTISPPCRDCNDALATVVRPVDGEQTITSYDHDDHIYDDHTDHAEDDNGATDCHVVQDTGARCGHDAVPHRCAEAEQAPT